MLAADEAGAIVLVNRELENQFGYQRDELIGQSVDMLLPERLRNRHSRQRETYNSQPMPRRMEVRGDLFGLRKDGREFPVEIALNPVRTSRGFLVLGVVVDVSARKEADARMREKIAELNRSNEELAQFANIASHDLQEPLRMVASYTELLARRYKGKLDRDADEFIGFAVDGAARMQRLIQDLLAYAKIGAHDTATDEISSEKAFEQAMKNLRGATEASGARITHDALPMVHGNEMQLVQLLQNLVGNAIKYQNKDSVPEVHISAARHGDDWTFSVRDNGIGIEPQYFDRIFGMFQRLHKRGEYAGTGMGLAMCKKIVELNGGKIAVESKPGTGSTFIFTWPGCGSKA